MDASHRPYRLSSAANLRRDPHELLLVGRPYACQSTRLSLKLSTRLPFLSYNFPSTFHKLSGPCSTFFLSRAEEDASYSIAVSIALLNAKLDPFPCGVKSVTKPPKLIVVDISVRNDQLGTNPGNQIVDRQCLIERQVAGRQQSKWM